MQLFQNNDFVIKKYLEFIKMEEIENIKLLHEYQTTGALCIGNLARSDNICNNLLHKYETAQCLIALLKHNEESDPLYSIKVLHSSLGALKNLSLAESCRSPMAELGLIGAVAKLVKLPHASVLHPLMIGIIKNLCTNNGFLLIIQPLMFTGF
jgi:hypothetical protein